MSLGVQFQTIGWMICSGMGLGVVFDIYRVLSGQFRIPRWLLSFLDCMYGIIAALAVFRVLFLSNHGYLRFFVFIGLGIGIAVYYYGMSRKTMIVIRKIVLMVRWLCVVFIITPLKTMYKIGKKILLILKSLTIFFYKIMLQLLYPFRFLIRLIIRWVKHWIPGRFRKF